MNPILTNSSVLITGGAGFIGSNLVETLLNQNNRVTCLDNFSTGKKDNIIHFLSNPLFTLIEGDIRNYEDCFKAAENKEYIFHQAALGSVPRSIQDPITTNEVNIGGFVKMIYAAKEANVKRFIYAASSSTYGDHPGLPKVEEHIGNPLSPYAITKYVDELYAKNFSELYQIETIGLRYFNVFGRKQDPDGAYAAVIPKFVKQLIKGEAPIINGDGTTSRDFTYIDNVVQINQLAAIATNPKAINQVYNVACGENNNLNQLVQYLKEMLSKYDPRIASIETIYAPERAGDVKHSLACIDKAKAMLNYQPSHLFKEGLKEAIDWYWNNLK